VSATPPGRTVKLKVFRDGKTVPLTLKTAVMPGQRGEGDGLDEPMDNAPDQPEKAVKVEWLGAEVAPLNPRTRGAYGIEDEKLTGVVVVNVPPQSIAADAGLAEGDVIQAVNRIRIAGITDLKKIDKKVADPKKGFLLDVWRRGRSFYLSYKSID
jgi:serine protease Do